jgi:hypothetical protein
VIHRRKAIDWEFVRLTVRIRANGRGILLVPSKNDDVMRTTHVPSPPSYFFLSS